MGHHIQTGVTHPLRFCQAPWKLLMIRGLNGDNTMVRAHLGFYKDMNRKELLQSAKLFCSQPLSAVELQTDNIIQGRCQPPK